MSVTDRTSRNVLDAFTGFVTGHTGAAIDFTRNIEYVGTVNLPEGTTENVSLGRPFIQPWREPVKVHALANGTPFIGVRQGEALLWVAAEIPDYGPCVPP